MKVLSAPHRVTLNITNRCNLSCLYCGVSSSKNAPGDLSLDEWKGVIDELARIKVFSLLISGGEPFMRHDFVDILKHIFQYHFRVAINSNGTLFNMEVLSFLAESTRLEGIQVSLDGPDAETHDRIRGKGTFKKILEGIEKLRRVKIPFSFFVVVCRNNMDRLEEIVHFGRNVGASMITFCSILPQGSALSHLPDLFPSFDEEKKIESELSRLKQRYPELVDGSLIQGIEQMNRISRMTLNRKTGSPSKKITSCGGSVTHCSIRPEGWVIPCDRLWDYKAGHVREAPFQSIWLHSKGFRDFRTRYSRTIDSFPECKGCPYVDTCSGGCPAIPFNLGRGVDGWDYSSCYLVHVGKKAGYLI